MFVVLQGRVRVVLEPSGQEVAMIPAGGFFGEMSMLTGAPRTATVRALEDSVVMEIVASTFKDLATANPAILDHITNVISTRRSGLEEIRDLAPLIVPFETKGFLARMKKFLKMHSI